MPVKTRGRKPHNLKSKPYFPHASGYWAAKINGRFTYLCRWSTRSTIVDEAYQAAKAAAEERAQATADEREIETVESITVKDVINLYLTRRSLEVDRGELGGTTWAGYKRALGWVVDRLGDRRMHVLGPRDFALLNDQLANMYGTAQHKHVVGTLRMAFRWADENDYIGRIPKYGTEFRGPAERRRRRERATKALKLFTAPQLRSLVDAADARLRAMILLGINCAYLQSDCAQLPISFDDNTRNEVKVGRDLFIRFDRPKTDMRRKCTLWPETAEALKEVIGQRSDGLVFRTRKGKPIVHNHRIVDQNGRLLKTTNCDAIVKPFRELCKAVGCYIKGIGFSSLRTTFETRAWSIRSLSVTHQASIHWIMGHALSGPETPRMADRYLQDIRVADLRLVTNEIRDWYLQSRE